MQSDSRVLIVGAGEAGVAAADAMRQSGHRGEITLVNGEETPPYERPPLSKEVLTDAEAGPKLIHPVQWFAEREIKLMSSAWALSVDPDRKQALLAMGDGDRIVVPFDKMLFATGARPRRIPELGDDAVYLRTFQDGLALRARIAEANDIVVVGGGVIGLEVASSARSLGKRVTVLDVADRLMGRALALAISELLLRLHCRHDVDVRLAIGSLAREGSSMVLGNGDRLTAGLVVAGVGVIPNWDLAQGAGCDIANGIVVDDCGRTSVAGLYAAGDVASFEHPVYGRKIRVETWQHAGHHGAHVGRAMMGIETSYREIPWFWTDQFGMNLQMAGIADGVDRTLWRGEPDRGTAFHFAGDRLMAATTINNGRDMRPSIKLMEAGWRGDPRVIIDEARPLGKIVNELLAG